VANKAFKIITMPGGDLAQIGGLFIYDYGSGECRIAEYDVLE
jgi:hypothetical protein